MVFPTISIISISLIIISDIELPRSNDSNQAL